MKNKKFYSIYKKRNNDLVPLATIDSREEVSKYLNLKRSETFNLLKKSKVNWDQLPNGAIVIFRDTLE